MFNEWQVIYEHAWTMEFMAIVRKHTSPGQQDAAEDIMQDVRQELAIKLNQLEQSPDNIKAYLRESFKNTLVDYMRKREGYQRPPTWINKLGAAYTRIFKLLCMEKRAEDDIHTSLHNELHYSYDFISEIIAEIRAGVANCGSWRESISIDQTVNVLDTDAALHMLPPTPDAILEQMDGDAVVAVILGHEHNNEARSQPLRQALNILADVPLDDDERLLLRLIYTDGHSVSSAARALKLADNKARKQLQQLHERLKQALDQAGFAQI